MLEIKNLTHSFGERVLYKNVNLKINTGDKIGLVGENGTGKTTLINILSGKILCDEGDINFINAGKIGYLDQFAEIDRELTVFQYLREAYADLYKIETEFNNINEQLSYEANAEKIEKLLAKSSRLLEELCDKNFYAIDNNIMKIANGLGIVDFGLDTLVGNLSGGQRVKLMFAKLLLSEPDLLILDEPTNFLDTNHIEWLTKYLQEFEGNLVIISHDIPFLNAVVNKIWAIDLNGIYEYNGNYEKYKQVLKEKIISHNKQAEKQSQTIKRLEDYIAKNGVRAATARQAKSREKTLNKILEDKMDVIKDTRPPRFNFKYKNIDNQIFLVVKNLEIGYENPLLSNINFKLLNGEKIRISGFNGIGKTTLCKTILGEMPSLSGSININNNVVFGYYEQDHKFCDETHTPIEEMRELFPKMDDKEIRTALAQAGLTTKRQMQPISSLSGGEKCKVQLCAIMQVPCNLLILDEPTNHLDVIAKKALAKAINNFKGRVIYISHENEFANLIVGSKVVNLEKINLN